VSRLKLSNLALLFECAAENNDPAHAGCYNNVAADVSRVKLSNLALLFECAAENNDPAHAGCYGKSQLLPGVCRLDKMRSDKLKLHPRDGSWRFPGAFLRLCRLTMQQ